MASQFEVFQPAKQAPFQQGYWGSVWGASFGTVKDQLLSQWKLGIMCRFPLYAPLDALGEIAQERQMFQGPLETTAHFVPRLLNAWGLWTIGGTYWGLLAALAGAGYTTAYVVASNGYIYGPSSGVTAPDPINGITGNPPASTRIPPWYTTGSSPVSNEWQALTYYPLNSIVTPTTRPGTWFIATQSGTSASGQPTWPGVGGSVVDGGVTWTYGGNYTNQTVYPPWVFGGGDGQGDPGDLDVSQGEALGGPPSPDGAFWSRFVLLVDPYPASWTDVVNPPTPTTSPTIGEITLLQDIIAAYKPGKSACVGITAANGAKMATFAWPFTTTTHMSLSCWLSRAILTGDVPSGASFGVTHPQGVGSWLPNTLVTNAGGLTYVFTIPSSAYLNAHAGVRYLYSAPAGGTTGFSEPSWPTTIGNTVTDNGITWTCIASLTSWTGEAGATTFQA